MRKIVYIFAFILIVTATCAEASSFRNSFIVPSSWSPVGEGTCPIKGEGCAFQTSKSYVVVIEYETNIPRKMDLADRVKKDYQGRKNEQGVKSDGKPKEVIFGKTKWLKLEFKHHVQGRVGLIEGYYAKDNYGNYVHVEVQPVVFEKNYNKTGEWDPQMRQELNDFFLTFKNLETVSEAPKQITPSSDTASSVDNKKPPLNTRIFTLKNGQVIEGQVESERSTFYNVRTSSGIKIVFKDELL